MRALPLLVLSCVLVAGEPRNQIVDQPAGLASGGRHGEFSQKYLSAPHCTTAAATWFGGPDAEEFVSAAGLTDGSIVGFGNAWGPAFPEQPAATVWGQGGHSGRKNLSLDAKGKPTVDEKSPDRSGFMAWYSPDGRKLLRILRFDWGVASILTGRQRGEGKGLVIAGACGPHFASFAATVKVRQTLPYEPPAKPGKGKKAPDPSKQVDVYVAGLAADGTPEWLVVLEKNGDPPDQLFSDRLGRIWFDARGLRRIDADGRNMLLFNPLSGSGTTRWLGVHPSGEAAYFGGDRNTHTGAEPYRQPFFYKIGPEDKKLYTLWEPNPKAIGSKGDGSGLMSDSSPRAMTVLPNGTLCVTGWSDGGNTVFAHQALDYHQPVPSLGLGMSAWGMKNANSLAHMMMIDDTTQKTLAYTSWLAYLPTWFNDPKYRGAPNGIGITQVELTAGGLAVLCGSAATGFVQSSGCYWQDPKDGEKYGGCYVAVLQSDLTNAHFASYLPGYQTVDIAVRKNDVLVVGRSQPSDLRAKGPQVAPPTVKPVQERCGGGLDGHLILLTAP